jgi:hypothetical protein
LCRGREIILNDDKGKHPYIDKDDGKQPYSYVNSGIGTQRRVKSDETYAREDLDLARNLCRNNAAAAAEASSMD